MAAGDEQRFSSTEQRVALDSNQDGRTYLTDVHIVDWGEQFVSFGRFAVSLPQPCSARSGAEFEGFGLLRASNVESLLKGGFRFFALGLFSLSARSPWS